MGTQMNLVLKTSLKPNKYAIIWEMCRNRKIKKGSHSMKPFTVLAPAAGLEPATL